MKLKKPRPFINHLLVLIVMAHGGMSCHQASSDEIAANAEVAEYMKAFEGRGDQADDSKLLKPDEALQRFQHPEELNIDLLASEPLVNQPVEINFDHRGRLWVVQYHQYPYPAGLKVTGIDYHLRAQYDKVPEAPPAGEKGADKITLLEDTDGDGTYDRATDAIAGLNIATSVTWGRGRIWVLNPPYLLAYPDPDGDGFPDGDPRVHVRGFGLEDTHAVANSLRWGPDGWLYGANGSTTTATIYSSQTQGLHFKGQGIWRYHPETEVFELFAEGGGNTFHAEIDDKGRIYSGDNGAATRGQYYKQGAYYGKNWGKHGALTNPYAFGFLPDMQFEGEKIRFTHAFLRYGGNGLPEGYRDALIAINPLHNYLQLSRFDKNGSDFRTIDEQRILTTEDHWFRPVDIKSGPDGGVYIADWYDSRLSHINPRDTWHKSSGRIYRLRAENATSSKLPDYGKMSPDELVAKLSHPDRWHRRQALRQFGDRRDNTILPQLLEIFQDEQAPGQLALEVLWAINLSGGFDRQVAQQGLLHPDPYVRMWTIRLLGDSGKVAKQLLPALFELAQREKHPEVRSQLACSAKRLPAGQALTIIRAMVAYDRDADDPHNPLLIWWALEHKAEVDREAVISLFRERSIWEEPIAQKAILERLMQRYIAAAGQANYEAATQLLALAPSAQHARPLLTGLEEGLRGREITELSQKLLALVEDYRKELGESSLSLALRNQQPAAIERALEIITDPKANRLERLEYVRIFGEIDQPQAVEALLTIVANRQSSGALKQAALQSLGRYDRLEIGEKVVDWYPDRLRADPGVRTTALELFVSRPAWAGIFLNAIEKSKRIAKEDVPIQMTRRLLLLEHPELAKQARLIWPELRDKAEGEKQQKADQLKGVIKSAPGNLQAGKALFSIYCGTCHRLFDQGGAVGPDLTGYDRQNLDYLLLHTIDPHAEIREGFVNFLVETKDGRHMSGIVVDQSGGLIQLRSFNGNEITLSEDEVVQMKAQRHSLMPEGLLDPLSEEEVRGLFAYLMAE